MQSSPTSRPSPSPWYAVNLSLLFPGVGHVYGGQVGRGLLWFGLGFGLLLTTIWAFLGLHGNVQLGAGCLGMGVVLWVFSVIDAYGCLSQEPKPVFRSFTSQECKDETVKDLWFSVFLSQLLPGLGHLYAQRLVAGAVFLLMTLLWLVAVSLSRSVIMGMGLLWATACAQLAWQLSFQPLQLAGASEFVATASSVGTVADSLGRNRGGLQMIDPPLKVSPAPAVAQGIVRRGFLLAILLLLSRSLMFGSVTLAERWVEPFSVPSESMVPTLQVGDRILVSKSASYQPKRGDIVVFRSHHVIGEGGKVAESQKSHFFVKRLVALGGDQVEIIQGQLWVNGQPRVEAYLPESIRYELAPQQVPPGELFVLGDNRNFSFDSHVWGTLPTRDVVGHAYRISWPPERNQPLA